MMKHFRLMTAALCAAFLLCGMTAPAYAYSDEPGNRSRPHGRGRLRGGGPCAGAHH